MVSISILKFHRIFYTIEPTSCKTYGPFRHSHSSSRGSSRNFDNNPNLSPNEMLCRVGIFWDLDNKPPNSIPPYQDANKLRIAAASFDVVRYMVAYANSHTFSYVPHVRENAKRLNQIESARGSRKVKLVGKYSMKMEKYKKAASAVLTPKVGYGLADELKRAGFWVQTVLDKPQAADIALQKHMVDMMDHMRVECVVLVSDDSDFVDAKKEDVSVVENWKDCDMLKRLEWTYNPDVDTKKLNLDDAVAETSGNDDIEDIFDNVDDDYQG
ncbi:unnamed protein product [Trifolium pratense]|uniref:Uncharacterized protein n=1 Tax=Trifolium pratense TaxID=57577 RepID=A0ACB0LFQ9_TRIPR|nr:unnamed protein product [Trifolium pratense]